MADFSDFINRRIPREEGAAFLGKLKVARKLTSKARGNLDAGSFVFPAERRYPIHDEAHARNALARSSGKAEAAKVRAAVHAKYPGIGKSAGIVDVAKGTLKDKKVALLGAAVLGAATAIGQLQASKINPKTGKSSEQEGADKLVADHEKYDSENPGPKSYAHDMTGATLKHTQSMADVAAKHPRTTAAITGLTGAGFGWKLLPKLVDLFKPA